MHSLSSLSSVSFSQITKPKHNAEPHGSDFRILPLKSPLLFSLTHNSKYNSKRPLSSFTSNASVGSAEYVVEPETEVKFAKEVVVPGCSDSLVLLGTGYREKVFAIIGVKVYAAGFYANNSIKDVATDSIEGQSADEVLNNSSLFSSIFHAPLEKSLEIILVRDVDGKTFWNALNDVISPRIKEPTAVDESALLTFRDTFQGRDLKKSTIIVLTWIQPSKMLVSISSSGFPKNIDAEISSANVTIALFDAFFGKSPVSPTLKASIASGLVALLS